MSSKLNFRFFHSQKYKFSNLFINSWREISTYELLIATAHSHVASECPQLEAKILPTRHLTRPFTTHLIKISICFLPQDESLLHVRILIFLSFNQFFSNALLLTRYIKKNSLSQLSWPTMSEDTLLQTLITLERELQHHHHHHHHHHLQR